MEKDGWTHNGGNKWYKEIPGALQMPDVPVGQFVRRTVRDSRSNYLLEDLWRTGATPEKLLSRAFRTPKDISVEVIMEVDDVGGDVPWEEKLMEKADATKLRAVVARLNFFIH